MQWEFITNDNDQIRQFTSSVYGGNILDWARCVDDRKSTWQ